MTQYIQDLSGKVAEDVMRNMADHAFDNVLLKSDIFLERLKAVKETRKIARQLEHIGTHIIELICGQFQNLENECDVSLAVIKVLENNFNELASRLQKIHEPHAVDPKKVQLLLARGTQVFKKGTEYGKKDSQVAFNAFNRALLDFEVLRKEIPAEGAAALLALATTILQVNHPLKAKFYPHAKKQLDIAHDKLHRHLQSVAKYAKGTATGDSWHAKYVAKTTVKSMLAQCSKPGGLLCVPEDVSDNIKKGERNIIKEWMANRAAGDLKIVYINIV